MEVEEQISDAQRHQNYLELLKAIEYLENGGRVTEDWTEDSKQYIRKWRQWIPDFNVVNDEREDEEFRKVCSETETIMKYLHGTVDRTGYVDPKLYLLLLQHMKKILDMLESDEEFAELLSSMKM